MSKEESVENKKKRLLKSESPHEAKKIKAETMLSEEDEAIKRDPMDDLKSFHASCDFIKMSLKNIKDLKSSPKNNSIEIASIKMDAIMHFAHMKKLNRLAHFRCRKVRETTNEEKNKINQCHLQLQNLLYEVMHLQKEITKCMEFKSKDEEIELVSEEEFYRDAPESLSKPAETKEDPHLQMLARLEWELEQRKKLAADLKELRQSKERMTSEIQSLQDYLETLQPKLASILAATRPVQEYLELPFDATREEHSRAQHLASPLYILYMHCTAYREACDKELKVSIHGDTDAAKSLGSFYAMDLLDEDSDSEDEQEKEDGKKHRRKTTESRQSDKKSKVLKKHPLNVVLEISAQGVADLHLTFHYLMALNIVTVEVKVMTGSKVASAPISGGELLSNDLILDELYPGDHGNDSPNGANQFELKRQGLHEFSHYRSQTGRPYLWCQWMAGLQFLQSRQSTQEAGTSQQDSKEKADPSLSCLVRAQNSISAANMQKTIKLLRARMRHRTALLQQLSSLERGLIPIPPEAARLFPTKIVSQLSLWRRSTFADLRQLPHAIRFIEAGLAKESDMIFQATLDRAKAKLTAHVVLTANCPLVAPVFIIEILWHSSRTALNDVHVMELESEINIHYQELLTTKASRSHLLASQLQRLLMCFDVYLETDTPDSSVPREIPKEKMMPRTARGPGRSKPYKYLAELGIFAHRG